MPPLPAHIELPENTRGRDFVLADLHGHVALLEDALASRGFDPANDRVLAVGDLVDRGPASARVLELLASPWFFSVRGNHEQAMLDWVDAVLADQAPDTVKLLAARHFNIGGDWALGLLTAAMRGERAPLQRWHAALTALPFAMTTSAHGKRVGIVHASVPGGDWAFFRAANPDPHALHLALWARRPLDDVGDGVRGIDLVFAGHNQVPAIRVVANFRMIETAAWAGGPFTLVALDQQALSPRPSWPARLWRGMRPGA